MSQPGMPRGGGYGRNQKRHDGGGFRGGGRQGGRGGDRNGQNWGGGGGGAAAWGATAEPPKPKPVEMDTDPTPIFMLDGKEYPKPLPLKTAQALRALRAEGQVDPQTRPILESWEKRVVSAIQLGTTVPEPPNWQPAVSRPGGWGQAAASTDQSAFLTMAQATTNKKGKQASKKAKEETKKVAQVNKQDLNRLQEDLKEKVEEVRREVRRVQDKLMQRDMVIQDLQRFLRSNNQPGAAAMPSMPRAISLPGNPVVGLPQGQPMGAPIQGGQAGKDGHAAPMPTGFEGGANPIMLPATLPMSGAPLVVGGLVMPKPGVGLPPPTHMHN